MCQGENIMEDNRREEKEALKVLTEYSPKLLKSMRNVMEELHGNRQPDTDEYLFEHYQRYELGNSGLKWNNGLSQ